VITLEHSPLEELARRARLERRQQTLAAYQRAEDALLRVIGEALFAPPKIGVAEWANQYRQLSAEASPEHGQWIGAKAPYQREPMNAASDPFVRVVVLMWASQTGKTEVGILNPLGYHIDQDPCPILIVEPTLEMADSTMQERILPMLRDTRCLRGKLRAFHARDGSTRKRRKFFSGGFVVLAGANSPVSLASRPVRIVKLNEVDRYPVSARNEGDPCSLAIARCTNFWNKKIVFTSSPTLAGASRIEAAFSDSTQEYWYLPCPSCEHLQVLKWSRLDFATVTLRCERCARGFDKVTWLRQPGRWIAHAQHAHNRGFHLSALISPWIEWEELIAEFRAAKALSDAGDHEKLKVFVNTRLAEVWEDRGERVEHDLYADRREIYPGELPDACLVLTAGIDVQDTRVLYEVVAWGRGRESWGIEYGVIVGEPHDPHTWKQVDEKVLDRIFTYADGAKARIKRICVDSGHATNEVYAYTKARQPRCFAIKGEGGLGKPLIKSFRVTGKERATLFILGVDTGKDEIVSRLRVDKPGPGYCHFPMLPNGEPARGYSEQYFEGLTAEKRVTKFVNGFKTYIWVKRSGDENEPFDCRNYALAALVLSGVNLDTSSRDVSDSGRGQVQVRKATGYGAQGVSASTSSVASINPGKSWGAQKSAVQW
jgi:phage terminase large subunit GpA-like protein